MRFSVVVLSTFLVSTNSSHGHHGHRHHYEDDDIDVYYPSGRENRDYVPPRRYHGRNRCKMPSESTDDECLNAVGLSGAGNCAPVEWKSVSDSEIRPLCLIPNYELSMKLSGGRTLSHIQVEPLSFRCRGRDWIAHRWDGLGPSGLKLGHDVLCLEPSLCICGSRAVVSFSSTCTDILSTDPDHNCQPTGTVSAPTVSSSGVCIITLQCPSNYALYASIGPELGLGEDTLDLFCNHDQWTTIGGKLDHVSCKLTSGSDVWVALGCTSITGTDNCGFFSGLSLTNCLRPSVWNINEMLTSEYFGIPTAILQCPSTHYLVYSSLESFVSAAVATAPCIGSTFTATCAQKSSCLCSQGPVDPNGSTCQGIIGLTSCSIPFLSPPEDWCANDIKYSCPSDGELAIKYVSGDIVRRATSSSYDFYCDYDGKWRYREAGQLVEAVACTNDLVHQCDTMCPEISMPVPPSCGPFSSFTPPASSTSLQSCSTPMESDDDYWELDCALKTLSCDSQLLVLQLKKGGGPEFFHMFIGSVVLECTDSQGWRIYNNPEYRVLAAVCGVATMKALLSLVVSIFLYVEILRDF